MMQPAPPTPFRPSAFFTGSRPTALGGDGVRPLAQAGRVLACLDDSAGSSAVVRHALAIARSLDLSVTLARVLETPHHIESPADPLEWQLQRNQGREQLERMAMLEVDAATAVESVLLAGPAAEELSHWAQDHEVSLMVLGTQGWDGHFQGGLGTTAQKVLDRALASLLFVPPSAGGGEIASYRRLLVPLDGSSRAESVLPIATRIARAHRAELILAHVVPHLEVVRFGTLEPQTRELRDKLDEHNDKSAHSYLEGLRRQLGNEEFPIRTIVARDGDARAQLRRMTIEQDIDLVVLSSHGWSGLADMACGSVTEYLATHAPAPLLIVRPNFAIGFRGAASKGVASPVELNAG